MSNCDLKTYWGVTTTRQHYQIDPEEGGVIEENDKLVDQLVKDYPKYREIVIYCVEGEKRAKIWLQNGEYVKLKKLNKDK